MALPPHIASAPKCVVRDSSHAARSSIQRRPRPLGLTVRAVHLKVRPGFAGCCELDYLRKREIPPERSTVSRPAERDPQPENGLYGKFDDLLEGSHTHPEEREEHRPDAGAARSDPPGVGEAFAEAFPRGGEGRALLETADAVICPGSTAVTDSHLADRVDRLETHRGVEGMAFATTREGRRA